MFRSFLQLCPNCQSRLEFKVRFQGSKVACKKCNHEFTAEFDSKLIAEDFRRLLRILAFAAQSDGEFDPRESQVLQPYVEAWLSYDNSAAVESTIREGQSGKHLRMPRSLAFRALVAEALIKLIAADGVIDPKEEKVVKKLAEHLKVDAQVLLNKAYDTIVDQMVVDWDDGGAAQPETQPQPQPQAQIVQQAVPVTPQPTVTMTADEAMAPPVPEAQSVTVHNGVNSTAHNLDPELANATIDETLDIAVRPDESGVHQYFISNNLMAFVASIDSSAFPPDTIEIDGQFNDQWEAGCQAYSGQSAYKVPALSWNKTDQQHTLIATFEVPNFVGELHSIAVMFREDLPVELWIIELAEVVGGSKVITISTVRNAMKLIFYRLEMSAETPLSQFLELAQSLAR